MTRETDYAIRIAVFLARQYKGDAGVSSADVALNTQAPYRFLRKIVRRMAAAGLVESTRGRGGGLRLKRAPRRISMLDIVTVMGANSVKLSPCVVRRGGCSRSARCRVHRELQSVQDVVDKRLQALTLDRLV